MIFSSLFIGASVLPVFARPILSVDGLIDDDPDNIKISFAYCCLKLYHVYFCK